MVKKFFEHSKTFFTNRQSSLLSAAAIITLANLLSALLGLVRNRILVAFFFKTPLLQSQLDAYWVAFRLPELVFQLLVIGAMSAAFIPVFSKYYRKSEDEAYHISSSVLNIILLVFLLASVVIFVGAEKFNGGITSANFTADQVHLAAQLTRIMLVAQFFFAVSNFLTGIIQSQHRFLIPALSPLAYNLGIIVSVVVLAPWLGIYSAAIGVVIGAFLHFAFQFPLARRLGFRYRFKIDYHHPGVKEIMHLMLPRTLAISVNQLEVFASVYFATGLSAGSLTIFNLAQQLMSAPIRIFSVPIGQASLPFLVHETAGDSLDNFKRTLLSSLNQILYLAFPASMLLLVLRIPLVRLAYGAKEFPWQATLLTGKVVAILAFSIFAQSMVHILSRAFYALHNTRIPFIVGLVAVLVNIIGAAITTLIFHMGVSGLAIAMTLSSFVNAGALFILLKRTVGGFDRQILIISPLKMGIATAITGLALWGPMRWLDQFVFDTTRTVPLILLTISVSLFGLLVYIICSYLLKINELKAFTNLIPNLKNWRSTLEKTEEVIEPSSQTQETKPL